ncbi:MAG: M28 family peptidase, partial [Bacteroidota bacterium]
MSVPKFDGQNAYKYLTAQTDFGPRNPGSDGYHKCLRFLRDELRTLADAVSLQEFSNTNFKGETFKHSNIIAQFNSKAFVRILLTAHWDTRPWADNDQNPANHTKPILGANDGASGVAVLLEIARQLKAKAPPIGVDMALFDCEDTGRRGEPRSFAVGSQYLAKHLPPGMSPRFAVNLDMVGDRMLSIPRE